MLVHHADAQFSGHRWTFYLCFFAIPDDMTAICFGRAVDDFHQGTFTSTVFTQDGMNLPRLDF